MTSVCFINFGWLHQIIKGGLLLLSQFGFWKSTCMVTSSRGELSARQRKRLRDHCLPLPTASLFWDCWTQHQSATAPVSVKVNHAQPCHLQVVPWELLLKGALDSNDCWKVCYWYLFAPPDSCLTGVPSHDPHSIITQSNQILVKICWE